MTTRLEVRDIDDIAASINAIEQRCRTKGIELLKMRFDQGCELKEVMNGHADYYGEGAVDKLAKKTNLSSAFLYDLHTIAHYFNFNTNLLDRDIERRSKMLGNVNVSLYVKEICRQLPPKSAGERVERKEVLLRTYEKGLEAREQLKKQFPDDSEIVGVDVKFVEIENESPYLELIRDPNDKFPLKHDGRIVDEDYLDFLRSLGCAFTGSSHCEINHFHQKGNSGAQATDYMGLPMTHVIHVDCHDNFSRKGGLIDFEKKYSKLCHRPIDVRTMIIEHWAKYVIHLKSLAKL